MVRFGLGVVACLLSLPASGMAQSPFALADHAGSGCPIGSVQGVWDAAEGALVVLYDALDAVSEAGMPRAARKSCTLRIQAPARRGYRAVAHRMAWEGSRWLEGADARLSTRLFVAGAPEARAQIGFPGPVETGNFTLETELSPALETPCGRAAVITGTTQIHVRRHDNDSFGQVIGWNEGREPLRQLVYLTYRRCG